jgi:hypothetical protein
VRVCVAVPRLLLAVRARVKVPLVVGVRVIVAVPLALVKVTPAGSAPDSVIVGAG